MHPDTTTLAAYLDDALSDAERRALRAHILTCAACTSRIELLRADARRIASALASTSPAPDVRADVRARLRRPPTFAWLGRAAAIAGALAGLLLFAALIGASAGITVGRTPDRLLVIDRRGGRIVALDARNGAQLAAASIGSEPTTILYDAVRRRLYVMLRDSIVAVDPRTLQPIDRWIAPQQLSAQAGMALDARGSRLYVAQPGGVVALALDAPEMTVATTISLGDTPGALAVAPDDRRLFALAPGQARLWTIALDSAPASARSIALGQPDPHSLGWMALSHDGTIVYVLLVGAPDSPPTLWRVDRGEQVAGSARLAELPPPWDVGLLSTGQLAIPRGDGMKGGVELVDSITLATIVRIDPQHDQHHLAVGPAGAAFGLNFTSYTVTRFDTQRRTVEWRTPDRASWQPWDAVYVPGSWWF